MPNEHLSKSEAILATATTQPLQSKFSDISSASIN